MGRTVTNVDLAVTCTYCGNIHAHTCPRVRAMEYHPNGALARVEFWPDTLTAPTKLRSLTEHDFPGFSVKVPDA